MEHFATLILRRPTMTSFRFYYYQCDHHQHYECIWSSSPSPTSLSFPTSPMSWKVLGGWTLGADGSSQKSDAYFCGGGNTTTVLDIYGGYQKYENTLKTYWKSETLNWQLREGLTWCWWQLTRAFVIPMAHFWNQLLPLQTRCERPIFWYSDIQIFWHPTFWYIPIFWYSNVLTHCFLRWYCNNVVLIIVLVYFCVDFDDDRLLYQNVTFLGTQYSLCNLTMLDGDDFVM